MDMLRKRVYGRFHKAMNVFGYLSLESIIDSYFVYQSGYRTDNSFDPIKMDHVNMNSIIQSKKNLTLYSYLKMEKSLKMSNRNRSIKHNGTFDKLDTANSLMCFLKNNL